MPDRAVTGAVQIEHYDEQRALSRRSPNAVGAGSSDQITASTLAGSKKVASRFEV
jgi:hypothetical protein